LPIVEWRLFRVADSSFELFRDGFNFLDSTSHFYSEDNENLSVEQDRYS